MCVWVYICTWEGFVCACVFADQYITLGVTILWDRLSHWSGTLQIEELTRERASGSPPLQPLDYKWTLSGQTFRVGPWEQTHVLMFAKHTLYRADLPAPATPSRNHTYVQMAELSNLVRLVFCLVLAIWLLMCICICHGVHENNFVAWWNPFSPSICVSSGGYIMSNITNIITTPLVFFNIE